MTAVAPEKAKSKVEVSTTERAAVTPSPITSPFDEMERIFDTLMPRGWFRPFRFERPSLLGTELVPRIDLVERDDELVVRAELPGVEKKDVEVSVNDNLITIKGSSRREVKEERGDYYRCEIAHGDFRRTVALPVHVNASKVKANMKDGLLEVVLPKVEEAKRQSVRID